MHRRHVYLAALLAVLWSGATSSRAEAQGKEQPGAAALAKRVADAVAATKGELPALKAFDARLGLPTGLSRERAQAMTKELWAMYKQGIVQAGSEQHKTLGELPPTMWQLIQQAQGKQENQAPGEKKRVRITVRTMPLREFKMPFALLRRERKGAPEAGRPLFICTHGGGGNGKVNGPHAWPVNSREWRTQVTFALRLYQPEGLYFVPRMADDRKGRWRHAHHQDQFELAIRHGILFWGVDPNRVYKLGISQGGFGSAILGVFMPDLFAGINPMAGGVGLGNPPENLRNLPCFTSVGERDTMFNRVGHAIAFHKRLDELKKKDPRGYANKLDVQRGRGHGIDYRPGSPWIAKHTRNPHPDTVIWTSKEQSGRRRQAMYWLELNGEDLKGTIALTAKADRETNTVTLTAHQLATQNAKGDPTQIGEQQADARPLAGATVSVLLNDKLIDLDKPVTVTCNGKQVFKGKAKRDGNTLLQTMVRRGDWNYAFPARVRVKLD